MMPENLANMIRGLTVDFKKGEVHIMLGTGECIWDIKDFDDDALDRVCTNRFEHPEVVVPVSFKFVNEKGESEFFVLE